MHGNRASHRRSRCGLDQWDEGSTAIDWRRRARARRRRAVVSWLRRWRWRQAVGWPVVPRHMQLAVIKGQLLARRHRSHAEPDRLISRDAPVRGTIGRRRIAHPVPQRPGGAAVARGPMAARFRDGRQIHDGRVIAKAKQDVAIEAPLTRPCQCFRGREPRRIEQRGHQVSSPKVDRRGAGVIRSRRRRQRQRAPARMGTQAAEDAIETRALQPQE
jgi:hypothetical protein